MGDDDTTIRVSQHTWRQLNRLKDPGQSFDEVIAVLLDEAGDNTEEPVPNGGVPNE